MVALGVLARMFCWPSIEVWMQPQGATAQGDMA